MPRKHSHLSLNSTLNPGLPHNATHRDTPQLHRSHHLKPLRLQCSPLPCLTLPWDFKPRFTHPRCWIEEWEGFNHDCVCVETSIGCRVVDCEQLAHGLQDSGPKVEEKGWREARRWIGCVPWLEAELWGTQRRSASVRGRGDGGVWAALEQASSVYANLKARHRSVASSNAASSWWWMWLAPMTLLSLPSLTPLALQVLEHRLHCSPVVPALCRVWGNAASACHAA